MTRGRKYVMMRMGFGLSIALKFMTFIVRWVAQGWPDVDSFVDDIKVPAGDRADVAAELLRYSLPTKPAEPLPESRVLGLQLSPNAEAGTVKWACRECERNLGFNEPLTKREAFKWTGRLMGHYRVCSWLRPACTWLRRRASEDIEWDALM